MNGTPAADMQRFTDRLHAPDDLGAVVAATMPVFGLPADVAFNIIPTGYEDVNCKVTHGATSYVLKIFSRQRQDSDIERLETIFAALGAQAAKTLRYVAPAAAGDNNYVARVQLNGTAYAAMLFPFVQGGTLYTDNQPLADDAVAQLAQQAAALSEISITLPPIYDYWSCENFATEYQKKKNVLSPDEVAMLQPALESFARVGFATLPRAFGHGDIISTNVIKAGASDLRIIDFSAADNIPRIQELAVLMSDCLLVPDAEKYANNFRAMLKTYETQTPLEPQERAALLDCVCVAHGVHYLNTLAEERMAGNDTAENAYFHSRGTLGLGIHPQLVVALHG